MASVEGRRARRRAPKGRTRVGEREALSQPPGDLAGAAPGQTTAWTCGTPYKGCLGDLAADSEMVPGHPRTAARGWPPIGDRARSRGWKRALWGQARGLLCPPVRKAGPGRLGKGSPGRAPAPEPAPPPQEAELERLEREFAIQSQITEAARRLASDPNVSKKLKKQRKTSYLNALRRLQEVENAINESRVRSGKKPTQRASLIIDGQCRPVGRRPLKHGAAAARGRSPLPASPWAGPQSRRPTTPSTAPHLEGEAGGWIP